MPNFSSMMLTTTARRLVASQNVQCWAGVQPRVCSGFAARSFSSVTENKQNTRGFLTKSGKRLSQVGIIGSGGAVGQEMLKCLQERDFPTESVRLFEAQDIGKTVETSFGTAKLEPFSVEAAQECEIVLMAVSGEFSEEFAFKIAGGPKDTLVIDNSSAWRLHEDVPLVIPEINGDAAQEAQVVSNPNCTTSIGAMALWPLHQKYKIKKVLMSTYQAASGAGNPGMNEVLSNMESYVHEGKVPAPEVFAHQLLFNVIPQIDAFQENGYTKEEMKVSWELPKIFGEDMKVACTAVRVPTLRAHSESITIETEKPISPDEARDILGSAPGIKVVDDPDALSYPLPLNVTGKDDVEVGRVRQSLAFDDHGLEFFVSGDQLLRGAALNAVLIAEMAAKDRYLAAA